MEKSPEQVALESVRELVKRDRTLEASLRAAWDIVVGKLGEYATHHKLASFEFRHMSEKARGVFMRSIAAGDDTTTASAAALTNVGVV